MASTGIASTGPLRLRGKCHYNRVSAPAIETSQTLLPAIFPLWFCRTMQLYLYLQPISMLIPEVNASSLFNENDTEHPVNRERVRVAAEEVGFMTLSNSDISQTEVTRLINIYRQFFMLPDLYKSQYDMASTNSNRGWGAPGSEQVDPLANPDFKQVFDCGPELDPKDSLSTLTYYAPNRWPDQPAAFETVIKDYYHRASALSLKLLSAVAMAIEQPADYFNNKFDKPMALLRGNYYPPRPVTASDKDFGIAPHTDYGCLTLLAMDGSPGLEVQLRNGRWEPVTVKPGTFVINFGEMLQMWTNGRVVATPHRVIGGNNERISIPFFFNPEFNTNVSPSDSGQITLAGDYLSKRYNDTYVHRQGV